MPIRALSCSPRIRPLTRSESNICAYQFHALYNNDTALHPLTALTGRQCLNSLSVPVTQWFNYQSESSDGKGQRSKSFSCAESPTQGQGH